MAEMDNLNQVFDSIEEAPEVKTDATATAKSRKDDAIAQVKMMQEAIKQTIAENPDVMNRFHSLSQSLEVVNTLGYKDSGNLIVDKEATTKDKRVLTQTSEIVGYRVRNVGETPITYEADVWEKGEDGKYVATRQTKTMAPGETADLSRKDMSALTCAPEFSFTLKNGKMVASSGSNKKKDVTMDGVLKSYYFKFEASAEGVPAKQVNDDEVKLNISEKVGEHEWKIKDEFIAAFGFLANPTPKSSAPRAKGGSKSKFSAQELAANYVYRMMQGKQA